MIYHSFSLLKHVVLSEGYENSDEDEESVGMFLLFCTIDGFCIFGINVPTVSIYTLGGGGGSWWDICDVFDHFRLSLLGIQSFLSPKDRIFELSVIKSCIVLPVNQLIKYSTPKFRTCYMLRNILRATVVHFIVFD
jgi:hypothetical protein